MWADRKAFVAVAALIHSGYALTAERCINSVQGIQIAADAQGVLTLYVYENELGGSNYLYYSGNNEALLCSFSDFRTKA
jgi:hypothetical protein